VGLGDGLEGVAALHLDLKSAASTARALESVLAEAARQAVNSLDRLLLADMKVTAEGALVVARTHLSIAALLGASGDFDIP
jgi:hypothetical protein